MLSRAVGVRLAGRGGQGVMLAAFLLAQAGVEDGLQVVQTQSYGPEARLGAAKSDVILSPEEIAYPEIVTPDVFLCLSHDAYVAYAPGVGDQALSLIEERAVSGGNGEDAILLPLTDTARQCGAALATNMVGLGALIGIAGLVSGRAILEALASKVAPDSLALNTKAFEAGIRLAAEYRERGDPIVRGDVLADQRL
jgi:2-oxoglutarate ferredoxin oxidoreductase subunit gamma